MLSIKQLYFHYQEFGMVMTELFRILPLPQWQLAGSFCSKCKSTPSVSLPSCTCADEEYCLEHCKLLVIFLQRYNYLIWLHLFWKTYHKRIQNLVKWQLRETDDVFGHCEGSSVKSDYFEQIRKFWPTLHNGGLREILFWSLNRQPIHLSQR